MNTDDLKKTLDYIQENNSWENGPSVYDRGRYAFKYIDICYDTRSLDDVTPCHIWNISLRSGGNYITFEEQYCTFEFIKSILDKPYIEVGNLLKENKVFGEVDLLGDVSV